MIEKFFTQQQTLCRMRTGIFGPHLPAIAGALHQAQYSKVSGLTEVRARDILSACRERSFYY
jgi:hypothetical protein